MTKPRSKYDLQKVTPSGVRVIRENTTLNAFDSVVFIDTTNDVTISLPDPSVLREGRSWTIKRVQENINNNIKIIPPSNRNINSKTELYVIYGTKIYTDGDNYFTLDFSIGSTIGYIQLNFPTAHDGVGAILQYVPNSIRKNGQVKFNALLSNEINSAQYSVIIPNDFDASIDLILKSFSFTLDDDDTGSHRYIIECQSISQSSTGVTFKNPIILDFTGDPNGASNDVEYITDVVLTG